ncbi:hypothetical protein JTB14_010422 [Gonioctena quinquepunctata]|nr:hypothetical protein JTB14_010422 [Gonioctena quinquepunctata]
MFGSLALYKSNPTYPYQAAISLENFKQLSHQILDSYESVFKREDINKLSQSDYPYFYKSLPSPNGLLHLKSPNQISFVRTNAQLKMYSEVFSRFTANVCLLNKNR